MNAEPPAAPPWANSLADVRDVLKSLYDELDQFVAGHHPVCELSGRCCRFKEFGHRLYLSAAEALLLVSDAPPPVRAIDDGETCPWQDHRGHCTAREARPLGCRVYFCDPRFESTAPAISEDFIARLKRLTEAHGWPWNYAALHRHLHDAVAEGRLKCPPTEASDPPGILESSERSRT